jgi:hypothetical protein
VGHIAILLQRSSATGIDWRFAVCEARQCVYAARVPLCYDTPVSATAGRARLEGAY